MPRASSYSTGGPGGGVAHMDHREGMRASGVQRSRPLKWRGENSMGKPLEQMGQEQAASWTAQTES